MNEYEYPFIDEKTGRVICQLCGKSYLVISPKHLQTHDVTYSEYKLRFPDAPLSCEEFTASSKYGKVKEMFTFEDETKVEEEIEDEPEIEYHIEKVINIKKEDLFTRSKNKMVEHLKLFFFHIQKDYMISFPSFQYISDFADPILKIDVECPNTFWHNDTSGDTTRNQKLKSMGWKVIEIKSKAPTYEDIEKAIKGYN